uniref:aldehyde dehydrogenase family protein n=1 Tax=Burkholderia gladioli TaxID=28095 RepID=UPI00164049DD
PFHHPLTQLAHQIMPSIATNNRIVVKPSEKVPLSCYLFADILYEAGLPPQMLQVLTGDPKEIADELITNPAIDLITFTGGVSIGKSIAARMGYRREVLELGGNDPIIVMEDADLDEASTLAVSGSYRNSGQRCTAIKRMLVNESIARGARLLVGNVRDGALYSPTVIDRVTPDMPLVKYETFGPVSPIMRFRDIDEAIRMSNSTDYALSSSVCTNRFDSITRFITELEVGSVNVREVPGYRLELTPFGGVKDSGLGYKEGVQEAMKSFTNTKTYSLPW